MATYLFQKMTKGAVASDVNLKSTEESREWYRESAKKISSRDLNMQKFTKSARDRFVKPNIMNISFIGKMILFNYDPKLKETLPYYDTYPLIFPIELYNDGFLGINLHYLPPLYRAKLMDSLYTTLNNNKDDEKKRLRISYSILSSASRFRYFRPCVKRYLYSHIRSRFFIVNINEWDMTLMLPLQRFVGEKQANVYKDSIKKFR